MTYIHILIQAVSGFARLYRLHHTYTNLQYITYSHPPFWRSKLVPWKFDTQRVNISEMSSVCSPLMDPISSSPLGFGWCFFFALFLAEGWIHSPRKLCSRPSLTVVKVKLVWKRLLLGPWIPTRSYESYCCDRNLKGVSTVNINILRMIWSPNKEYLHAWSLHVGQNISCSWVVKDL